MTGTSHRQFGLIIAYVLPGFIALVGLAPIFPGVAQWLRPVSAGEFDLGLGPPLYAVLGATAFGLVLSCFRWILIDRVHHWTGVERPAWEDSKLDRMLGGFDYLVQSHYRYYEFCGNSLLAGLFAYVVNRVAGTLPHLGLGTDVAMVILLSVLFLASRSALINYFTRTSRLIGRSETDLEPKRCLTETTTAGAAERPSPPPKPSPSQSPR